MANITVSVSSPGILAFGQGEFGDQYFGGDNLSATFGLGGVQFVFDNGWGSNLWGQFTYGIVGDVAEVTGSQINLSIASVNAFTDVSVTLSGQQLNSNITGVTITGDANLNLIGTQVNSQINSVNTEVNTPVDIQGSQINLDEGSVTTEFQPDAGWGVSGWGVVPWGLENDIVVIITEPSLAVIESPTFAIQIDGDIFINADEDHNLLISAPNGTTVAANANVNVTGSQLNVAEGLAGAVITANANVNVTGSQLNTVAGQAVGGTITPVDVTGSQINFTIGNEIPIGDANVSITGSQINLTPGQVTYIAGYDVTGSQVNLTVGTTTVTGNAAVNVTGIRLNTVVGSVNIQAWAEVQTGASNTWTPVDLAA